MGIQINIGDIWKEITNVGDIKINISDVWKNATEVYINIGNVWKVVSFTLPIFLGKIAAGNNHSLYISPINQIWGWGYDNYGQLGDNSTINQSTPVSILGTHKTFCSIAAAQNFSLGLDKNGQVWGWGYNYQGQLGDNSVALKSTPISILGNKKTFCLISSGQNFSLGLDYNGQMWSWGYNNLGQLGDNSTINQSTPVSILGVKKTFCSIAASNRNFSLGLDKNGLVWGWGYNDSGQLGDDSSGMKSTPVSILGAKKTFCLISTGNSFSLGLDKYGQVWGWGNNYAGQLGDNSTDNKSTPVSILGAKKTFCLISTGDSFSLGLDKNGQIWSWGFNKYGQLGDNSTDNKSTPVLILGAKKTFCSIEAGYKYSLAIDKNGLVWGWGYNYQGQLGDNSNIIQSTPIQIYKHWNCGKIVAGMSFSLYISSTDQIWSWGYNNTGQLGNNSTINQSTPVSILGTHKTFCSIAAGIHSLGLDKYGQVWGWGNNYAGQLGDNSVTSKSTPISILGAKKTFCLISGGDRYSLGLDKYGQIWSWGYNYNGRLGNNSTIDKSTPVSILGAKKTFYSIHTKNSSSLGLDKNGLVWGWGYNYNGQLGDNSIIDKSTPVSILGTKKTFCSISGNYLHSLGIEYNGQVWSWGSNEYGQLGDNLVDQVLTPVSILGAKKTFCSISAGNYYSLGLDKYGQVWSWGYNAHGQLGINSTTSKSTPVSILGTQKTFCLISAGESHSLGIDKYGQMWGWGYNVQGQLGDNSVTSQLTPVKIYWNVGKIAAGYNHSLYISPINQVWGWGYNKYGQLGDNSNDNQSTPVSILGAKKTFYKIAAGENHSLGIDINGLVWSWGYNSFGQLGINSTTDKCTPVSILGAKKTFCSIAAGDKHSLGIDKNGLVWSWGYNLFGQLGINSTGSTSTPVSILGAEKTFCSISSNYLYSLGIEYNGQVWSWGYNAHGQLGINSTTSKSTPVSILGTQKTFCFIIAGYNHSLGLDKYGQVWGWGYNDQGQLGDNSTTDQCTPVSILGTKITFCSIAAGASHSLGLDKNGLVWSWGYNLYGQLGDNFILNQSIPVTILGAKKTFCSIAAGFNFSLGLDKYGQVWGWGYNVQGQLGDNSVTSQLTPVKICLTI